MALESITAALAQYAENALWHESAAKASAALEALRYLRLHRAQGMGHTGSSLSYEMIESELKKIEDYLGVTGTTAPGKRRTGMYRVRRIH
jgi:hypothetical protein